MTDEQRAILETLAVIEGIPFYRAVKAALAEIDRLRDELAASQRGDFVLSRKLTEAAEVLQSTELALSIARDERDEAKIAAKANPPRPAAIVLPPELYAAFEHAAQARNVSVNDFVVQFLMAAWRASPLL